VLPVVFRTVTAGLAASFLLSILSMRRRAA
jgi:hypothetical protein